MKTAVNGLSDDHAPPHHILPINGTNVAGDNGAIDEQVEKATGKDGHFFLHSGEEGAGTQHTAAGSTHGAFGDGSLDVAIRVEIDQHDAMGLCQAYGLRIPKLRYVGRAVSSHRATSSGGRTSVSRSMSGSRV